MSTDITKEQWEQLATDTERQAELAAKLLSEGRALGMVNAFIVAGDMLSAERASKLVSMGMPAKDALSFVGSYARFQWAVDNLPRKLLFKMLPELWRSADPDDTKPEYLDLWRAAYAANGYGCIYDFKRKQLFPEGELIIYRGQIGKAAPGIAWTLDIEIARKFAKTGGGRFTIKGGVALKARVRAGEVLAYITGRGEQEIIVDPADFIEGPNVLKRGKLL